MSPRVAPRGDRLVDLAAGLASPFVDNELFQEEAPPGQAVRLATLIGETAFRLGAEGETREEVDRRAVAEGPDREAVESEIIGTNDMDAVASSLAVPYRWICRLDIDYDVTPFGTTQRLTGSGRGTGTLISPCHVLTAAHNLLEYDPGRRNTLRATRIRVTPAHDGSSSSPVTTVEADLSQSPLHRLWDITRRHDATGAADNAGEVETNRYDYALLKLRSAIGDSHVRALGGPLGYWGAQGSGGAARFERLDPAVLRSHTVFVAGYGADDCVRAARTARANPSIRLGSQLTATGQITLVMEGAAPQYVGRSMAHDVDTCGGQSGAPVALELDGVYYLVGVHTAGIALTSGSRTNHAVRVTMELLTQVSDWMTRVPCPAASGELDERSSLTGETLAVEEERVASESLERGSDLEIEDGMAGHAPAEWAMEWAADEDESPLTSAVAVETAEDTRLEYDTPPMTQALSEAEPPSEQGAAPQGRRSIQVIGAGNAPVINAKCAFHQGQVTETGVTDAKGRALFSRIDPSRPFLFEVPSRMCAIRVGAFFDPDDPNIEYGGTAFDWTLVRGNQKPDKAFWPQYQQAMDAGRKSVDPRTVNRFHQHEHITRRPIQVAAPFLSQTEKVQIQALPCRMRVGPFVRYTDHERAVIWLETVTPCMVRARYKKAGGAEQSRYASTVRVGSRNFAAVEIDGLEPDTFYHYTVELAPLPATAIPIRQADFADVFPELKGTVAESMRDQLKAASLDNKSEWLAFRTLRPRYEKLRFALGSCRWYPGDTKLPKDKKDLGPDMFDGLGAWLQKNPKDKWPNFLLFVGDQIYSDEIGDHHGTMLTFGRFAERIPGPSDPATSIRAKLVDGAWAGRFAHRYQPYKYPGDALVRTIGNGLTKLDDIYERYPDIKGIYHEYPDMDPREALKRRHETLMNRRKTTGAHGEAADEKRAREAVELLPTVDKLEIDFDPFRALVRHWNAGYGLAYTGNPMGLRYLSHNFLLWSLPDFEKQLPTLATRRGFTVALKPNGHGHPSAEGGLHAADFAEYAYLHERSWTSSRNVRVLLAHVPTFLMFDDHELTDDWNFDAAWVRMLHNDQDPWGMWPKTLTDALAAYWVYQGWCNKAPSQWDQQDPRVKALADAQRLGIDALPALRRILYKECFPPPPKDRSAVFQAGLALDWHYRLPFDPPFLVPDCRSRRRMVPSDDNIRIIDHDDPKKRPMSQTIDDAQLDWMRKALVDRWRGGPGVFIALSTPLLLQDKFMTFMQNPEVAARAWSGAGDIAAGIAVLLDSTKAGFGSNELLRVFRRAKDLEHMIRDKSWRDLWDLADAMRQKKSPVKSILLLSGDVHHSYCMTANLSSAGRPFPELIQITSSGVQTTIRGSKASWFAEQLGSLPFDVGKRRLVPGFMKKNETGSPDLALFQNGVALVDVGLGGEVDVVVRHLAGQNAHVFRYTSGATYMNMKRGMPAVVAGHSEIEQETDGATVVRRLPTSRTAICEGDPASPFLGERLFVREQDEAPPPSVDLIAGESPFTTYELRREEPVADTAELQPGEEERLGGNEEPTAELYVGKGAQADAFADREAEDDPGRLELEQGITGEDDRVEVADTTVAPYRWICSVTYEKGGATLDGGSGVLISDRHVLTAGHVIKEAGSGPDAPSLVIYPGRHYSGEPFGRYLASRTRLPNFNMDFGLITLTRPVDPALLWWGHPSTNTDWWSEAAIPLRQLLQTALPITTAGFPGAKDAYRRRMYEARGETVPARFGGVFRHTADTTRGQSGSPIWTERQGRRILIGLVTAFDELPNQIAVFAHDNLMQRVLRQWMAQDAPRPTRVERRIALEIPYRWACRLEVYDNDLRRTVGYGSGLLISNQHVLTSARVIHGFVQDRRRYAVSVAPGYEFGKEAFGSTTAAKGRTSPRFSPDSKDASAEFGLLTLSRALGTASFAAIKNAALGSWGGANYGIVSSAADWSGKPAHIAAFSRSAGGGGAYQKLRVSSGGFVGLTSGQILHRAGSKLDAPGAPLWVEAGDRRLLVGIATTVFSKDSEVNWGCYLSEEAQSHLRQWMNEDFERHETEAGDRFSQDETEIFAAEGGAEPEPEGVKAADESDDLSDMERGSDLEVEDGMAGHAPAEWAMEWADHEDESPLTSAVAVETAEDTRLEYDTPPMTQAISDAIDQKDWPRLLELAMQVGWHDENQLTNLLFYSRHPELDRRKLDPKKNKDDRKLADEWNRILVKEIRPAIHKAAEDSTLEVHGDLVAERDPELADEKGRKFKGLVAWAAGEVDMDPGFLAAVLLAEVGRASPYLSTGEVRSFFTGTDDFFAQRAQLRANVPAFAKVHFDEKRKTTNINEHGREVTTIPYGTGKDAALATAVYLKWGEIKLRRAMQKNGGDFDTLPVATRFVLVRVAMAAGHGGISPDGDLIRFKKKGDTLVRAKPGEAGGILLGVARSVDRVLKGEDILVRNFEPRKDPTNDSHITHRNATILASQALHLGDWFFRAPALGVQPELGR